MTVEKKMTVLACSVTQLLQASLSAWHQVADTVTHYSTCATINGKLVPIGRYNCQGRNMKDVYRYDSTKNA